MDNPWEMFNGVASRHEAVGKCEACAGTEWLMIRTYLGHTSRYIETEHGEGCRLAPPAKKPPTANSTAAAGDQAEAPGEDRA